MTKPDGKPDRESQPDGEFDLAEFQRLVVLRAIIEVFGDLLGALEKEDPGVGILRCVLCLEPHPGRVVRTRL